MLPPARISIQNVCRAIVSTVFFASTVVSLQTTAAPFAMPPYYNVPNDNKYPFYGDNNPTPEAGAKVSIDRANLSSGTPAICQPAELYDHITSYGGGGAPYYDGVWDIYETKRSYISNPPSCTAYAAPSKFPSAVRQWLVCDSRPDYSGLPMSSGYSKYNFTDQKCPDATTVRPEKCPFCPITGNPVNTAFGFKVLAETDIASPYFGGVEFRRYYTSHKYPNHLIVPQRALGSIWRHGYERGIKTVAYFNNDAYVLRSDTSVAYFYWSASGYLAEADSPDRLTKLLDGGGAHVGWQYNDGKTENVETYDATGRLTAIVSRGGIAQTLIYDGNGRLYTVEDSFGRTLTFTYDAADRIATVSDPASGQFAFTYDAYGNLATVTDPASKVRIYLYENTTFRNAMTGIIDENDWRYSRYTYDSYGKVTETKHYAGPGVEVNKFSLSFYNLQGGGTVTVTDPLGAARIHVYENIIGVQKSTSTSQPGTAPETRTNDANGNVASRTDFNGNKTCYGYDLTRNLETARVEGLAAAANCAGALSGTPTLPARKIVTTWHATYRIPATISEPTAAGSKVTTFSHDSNGNVLSKSVVVAGSTRTGSWTYDGYGRVLTATDQRSNVTTNTYYANDVSQGNKRGMLNTVTNAASHTTTITDYNAHRQPLSITDPNGLVTSMAYDSRQRVTSRTVGSEATVYDYDGVGQLTKVTLPDSSYLSYNYDGAHRLVEIKDGLNNRVVYTLDNQGNRTREDYVDPSNVLARTRSRVYDALNRLQKDIGGATPGTQISQYGYDSNGNQTSTLDPLSRTTSQTYDALNRLLNVIDPVNGAGAPTKYEYDAQDNLTKVTDPKNLATVYGYNGFNELTSQTSPDTDATAFTYDAAGNIATRTDARSVQATYTYDALNRVATISYPAYGGDAAETVTYTYDTCTNGKGRLCSIGDKAGTTTYSYSTMGRVTAKSQVVAGLTQSLSYGYNSAGQLNSVTYPSGAVIGYGYLNNRINSVTVNNVTVLSGADYEPFGPVGEWNWGNGSVQAPNRHVRYHDLDGRTIEIESIIGLDPTVIAYDAASRITDLQKRTAGAVDPVKSSSYGYDNLDRLTTVTPNSGNPNPTRSFSYDGVGNRLSATVSGSTTNYGYGSGSHRLNSLSGANSTTYTYDAVGNRATDSAATWTYGGNNRPIQVTVGGITTTFLINALGQRVKKATAGSGTRFVYDEAGRLIGEYSDSGARLTETVWFNDLPVAVMK